MIGKILDRIIATRLQHYMETNSRLAERQFGFRHGRSTAQALETLTSEIRSNKINGKHSLVVSMDIGNAFNTISHAAVETELRGTGCPERLTRMSMDFLAKREVRCGEARRNTGKGCPQGSCSGPILWLIAMEKWFREMEGVEDVKAQAYADDQVTVIEARSAKGAEKKWKEVERVCVNWASSVGLKYNANKTEAMWVGARKLIRTPKIRMGEQVVELNRSIKYLGVTIDSGLGWIGQARGARGRTSAMANKLFIVAGKKWGTSAEMLKRIYKCAVEPVILYGAEVWGKQARDTRIKTHMNAAQRPSLERSLRATGRRRRQHYKS